MVTVRCSATHTAHMEDKGIASKLYLERAGKENRKHILQELTRILNTVP